jgi:hypothetical protein
LGGPFATVPILGAGAVVNATSTGDMQPAVQFAGRPWSDRHAAKKLGDLIEVVVAVQARLDVMDDRFWLLWDGA